MPCGVKLSGLSRWAQTRHADSQVHLVTRGESVTVSQMPSPPLSSALLERELWAEARSLPPLSALSASHLQMVPGCRTNSPAAARVWGLPGVGSAPWRWASGIGDLQTNRPKVRRPTPSLASPYTIGTGFLRASCVGSPPALKSPHSSRNKPPRGSLRAVGQVRSRSYPVHPAELPRGQQLHVEARGLLPDTTCNFDKNGRHPVRATTLSNPHGAPVRWRPSSFLLQTRNRLPRGSGCDQSPSSRRQGPHACP